MEASMITCEDTRPPNSVMGYQNEFAWLRTIPSEYRDIDFESCIELPKPLVDYALQCVEAGLSLYLFGVWGSGKTTLAFALVRHLMRTRAKREAFWPRYITGKEIDSRLLTALKEDTGDVHEIYNFSDCDLLFIDDLDKMNPTERLKNQIFSIIDNRRNNNKITLITSNFSPSEMSKLLDGSVLSRMGDPSKWGDFIEFPPKDLRKNNIRKF
jgi:DNA replication protein DnaC